MYLRNLLVTVSTCDYSKISQWMLLYSVVFVCLSVCHTCAPLPSHSQPLKQECCFCCFPISWASALSVPLIRCCLPVLSFDVIVCR